MKLSTPNIDNDDINYVKKNLKSGWISTSALEIKKFEENISNVCGSKYVVALNSGTSAIHLALKIIGTDSSSEIIVPSLTFIATVNPVLYQGANPIIFDVNDEHNLKTDDVIKFIKEETIFKNKIGRIRDIQVHPANGKIYFLAGDAIVTLALYH